MSAHQCNHLTFLSVPLSCSPGGRSRRFYVSPSYRTKKQKQIWAPPPDQTCREEEEEREEEEREEEEEEEEKRRRRRERKRRKGKYMYKIPLSSLSLSYLSSDIFTNSLIPSCSEGGRAGVLFSSASSRPGNG